MRNRELCKPWKPFRLAQAKQYFPRDGSRATPPHPTGNFKWKDYCPAAFSKLRSTFHIDPADYMLSICGSPLQRL